jgi:spore maturation protein B
MVEVFVEGLSSIARYIIPGLLVGIPFYALAVRKVPVYEVFVDGAKDGFTIAVRIIPYLVAILVAVGMFRASGALDLLLSALAPVLNFVGFPPENLPLALMRPLSGSGSLGLLTDALIRCSRRSAPRCTGHRRRPSTCSQSTSARWASSAAATRSRRACSRTR